MPREEKRAPANHREGALRKWLADTRRKTGTPSEGTNLKPNRNEVLGKAGDRWRVRNRTEGILTAF